MLIAGCTEPGAAMETAHDQPAAACGVTVTFGSYAMGIDRPTFVAVEDLLAKDAAVTGVDKRYWGREGEVTLCVGTRTPADAARIALAIGAMLPEKPKGPITVSAPGGKTIKAGR
jgi:hypothetical protein